MTRLIKFVDKLLKFLLALFLTILLIIVFSNVFLRYVFSSGIIWVEEVASFLFVWIIFLGATIALKEKGHISVNLLLDKLSGKARQILLIISNIIIIFILWILFDGSLKITKINAQSHTAITGVPYSFLYGVGVLVSILMGFTILSQTYKILFSTNKNSKRDVTSEGDTTLKE